MGAIDLVVQIEAPPSVASGLQRIGRAGHRVDETSEGVIFPKFRGDLLACAAVTRAMAEGQVEPSATRAIRSTCWPSRSSPWSSMDHWAVDDLFATVRRAAPFAALTRRVFEGVLDMLSGRYPSDEFAELRPRVTWDRVNGTVGRATGRQARRRRQRRHHPRPRPLRRLPGRAARATGARVGELDEEMVFESRAGDTFLLGASTWRIEQITHDRVLVSPAPGEPGKMPFWHGEGPGRPVEFGRAIGELTRELRARAPADARGAADPRARPDDHAAENLLRYLEEQQRATGRRPGRPQHRHRALPDELGDWRLSC